MRTTKTITPAVPRILKTGLLGCLLVDSLGREGAIGPAEGELFGAAAGERVAAAPGGAAPGCGTVTLPPHPEQRTCRPAAEDGAVNCLRQAGH